MGKCLLLLSCSIANARRQPAEEASDIASICAITLPEAHPGEETLSFMHMTCVFQCCVRPLLLVFVTVIRPLRLENSVGKVIDKDQMALDRFQTNKTAVFPCEYFLCSLLRSNWIVFDEWTT